MKKLLKILFLIMLIISIIQISTIYALYKNELQGKYGYSIGKWDISVNGIGINEDGTTLLTITPSDTQYFEYEDDENVMEGQFAPGMKMYATYVIDPGQTDVAIVFEIKIKMDQIYSSTGDIPNIQVTAIDANFVKNDEKIANSSLRKINLSTNNETRFISVIPVDKIKGNYDDVIKIKMEWLDTNETDSSIGEDYDANFSIPVEMTFKQYTGESLDE